MASTAIVPVQAHPGLFSAWVMLPDGTVRKPYNLEDWQFWRTWGKYLCGWHQVRDTHLAGCRVSTVFLGLDHDSMLNWDLTDRENPVPPAGYLPLVFETMVFGGDFDGYQTRCRSLAGAVAMHEKALKTVESGRKKARKRRDGYKCPRCGLVSYNPHDRKHRYCGNCKQFEADDAPTEE